MSISHVLAHIGAASLVLCGLGHTATELAMSSRSPPAELAAVIEQMKRTTVAMPGRHVSLHRLMRGFSLMMGVCLMSSGGLLHHASWHAPNLVAIATGTALAALGVVLSLRYILRGADRAHRGRPALAGRGAVCEPVMISVRRGR